MDAVKGFKTIGLLALNFVFSFTVSNYVSPEIHLVKSPVISLKVFSVAYCLGYVVLRVFTSSKFYTNNQVDFTYSPVQTTSKVRYVISSILKWFIGVIVFHCLAVLYGAALSSYVEETFVWSVMMSCLVILPCFLGETGEIMRVIAGKQNNFSMAYCLCSISGLTIVGAWFGAFTLPLDWDRDWQVWPIPCAAGGMVGHFCSLVISFIFIYWELRKDDKNKLI